MIRRPRVLEVLADKVIVRATQHGRPIHSFDTEPPAARPVLKWAGGKQWLAPAAPHLLPRRFKGRYFEPFVGGGAIFFALQPGLATVSDRSQLLVDTYRALRTDAEGVISLLRRYPNDALFYYRMRGTRPRTPVRAAARFLYLNRTCWNGLYRVNRQGDFNTPFGRFINPGICDDERLLAAAACLRRATIRSGDFETVVDPAERGDFVYFDPPYITGHQHNGFLKYNASLFSWDDQKRLARVARRLAVQGVHVLVSNADQPSVVDLYQGFLYYRAARRSAIGGKVESRGNVTEALLASYPIMGCESEVI